MSGDLQLVKVDPLTDPRWDALMRGPRGSLFGAPPWLRAIASTYGLMFEAQVLVDDAGGARAGFTYVTLDDLRGYRRVSIPFVDRLDPIVDDAAQWARLSEPFFAGDVDVAVRVLDGVEPRHDPRLAEHHSLAWHSTDLARPIDEIFANLASSARTNIGYSERRDVKVVMGTELEDVRDFHALHRHTRKFKYHLLAQPQAFFEAIWREFAADDAIDVALARVDDDVIAGAMYLRWNDVYYYKFGASIGARLQLRPNEAVHWAGLRRGHERACRLFDWGVSDRDQPGLVRYKRKFATDERSVSVLRRVGAAAPGPTTAEAGRLLGELTKLLTDPEVPDSVSARAGELLYRYFA